MTEISHRSQSPCLSIFSDIPRSACGEKYAKAYIGRGDTNPKIAPGRRSKRIRGARFFFIFNSFTIRERRTIYNL